MEKMNVKQINENRRVMDASTIESPYEVSIGSGDADYGQRLYDNLPSDEIGLLPKGTK